MITNLESTSAPRHASNDSPRSEEANPDAPAIEAESIAFTDTDGTKAVKDASRRIHCGEFFGFSERTAQARQVVNGEKHSMMTITENQEGVTLINVFTVDPADQQALVDRLIEATEGTMTDVPGGGSGTIHKSLDGERVVNYAQWESKEAFEAMLDNPEATAHMESIREIASADFHLYEVVYTNETAD